MLNEKNIELANALLAYLDKAGKPVLRDNYYEAMRRLSFQGQDVGSVCSYLINNLDLVSYHGADTMYIELTPEGIKAAKIGVKEYFKQIEEDKQLDREAKMASIQGVKKANRNSLIAILIAVFIPLLIAVIQIYFYNSKNTINDRNNDSSIGTEINHSQHPFNLTDTVFIEKLTNTLIHDTLFLNELKILIKSELNE